MELQFAFFCDEVRETKSGKLDALGIFHDLLAPAFPAMQERMILALIIDWDRHDRGRYDLKAELVGPDGKVALTVTGHSDVQAHPLEGPPARTRLVMPLEKVVFPKPGKYSLRIMVKGKRLRGPSLYLLAMEEGETASSKEAGARP